MWIVAGIIIVVIVAAVYLTLGLNPAFGARPKGERQARLAVSPNYKAGKFVNGIPTSLSMPPKESAKAAFQFLFGRGERKPVAPIKVDTLAPAKLKQTNKPSVTWFGHSALLLELDGKTLLLDPMLGKSPSPVPFIGGRRFSKEPPVTAEQLPAIDAVLLSHDHYDHLDYGTIVELRDKVRKFLVPLGVGAHLMRWGVEPERIAEHDWWEELEYEGLRIACTPARHFSGRGLGDRDATLWCSWVIRGSGASVYFSGDSGYGPHFAEIGRKYGPFDITLMECGQYDERWSSIHMLPEQSVQAHIEVGGRVMLPIHWGAFSLAIHGWSDPAERALEAAAKLGAKVATPRIGETLYIGEAASPNAAWWRGR